MSISIDQVLSAQSNAQDDADAAGISATQAGVYAATAQAASEAAGLYKIYDDKADADADLANVPANSVVEVMVDETQAAARTRYRKESGAYVLKTIIGDQPSGRWFGKVAQKLVKARDGQCRIHLAGTSISTFQPSLIQLWARQLQRLLGCPADNISHDPITTWQSQTFGGPQFVRSRGNSASASFDYTTSVPCKSVVIRYSKETDGASFNVTPDGGAPVAINCNGAQSYRNEQTITFAAVGFHKLTFSPPASGFVYVEAIEERTEDFGVVIENSTLGGSASGMMFDGFAGMNDSGVTGIAVVGNNGVNAHLPASTDIFVWQWTVNDAGSAAAVTKFKQALDAAVARCRLNDTALVCVVEMAGHYGTPADSASLRSYFEQIRSYQLAMAKLYPDFVYALDWHALTYIPNDPVKYAATFYPDVVYNTGNNTYTGDFIHPEGVANRAGLVALCAATGIPHPPEEGFTLLDGANRRPAQSSVSPLLPSVDGAFYEPAVAPASRASWSLFGVPRRLTQVGEARTPAGLRPVFFSDDVVTMDNAVLSVASWYSGGTDEYGAYRLSNNQDVTLTANPGDFITVTALMRPRYDQGSGIGLVFDVEGDFTHYHGGVASPEQGAIILTETEFTEGNDPPTFYSITGKRGSGAYNVNFTGKVYGVWVTPTPFPCVTERGEATAGFISPQMLYQDDPLAGLVVVGQDYVESINSKLIEKVCVGRDVIKPNLSATARYGLYRARDLSAITRVRGGLGGTSVGTWTASTRQGGYVNPASNLTYTFPTLSSYAATYAAKRFTLLWRYSRTTSFDVGWQLYMKNGTSYTAYATLDGSNNVIWTEAAGNLSTTDGSIPLLLSTSVNHIERPLALTMDMPTLTGNMGDAPSFTLRPCNVSTFAQTTVNGGYAFLNEGSSALT